MSNNFEPLLRMENIHKWFGKVHAVNGVDLEVGKGEVVGLVGNNGAGKSTLIKTLVGMEPKEEGKFYWEGEEIEINSIQDSRRLGIEAVYQGQALVDCLDVVKNVFLGREPVKSFGPFKMVDYRRMKSDIKPLLGELSLRLPSLDQEVRFCSGGERQGIAITRAMLFRAKMVILDEPTTALSVSAVKRVLSFVEVMKEENISTIFISHNLDHVYSVADRFAIMSRGKKIADVEENQKTKEEIEQLLTDGIAEEGDMQ